MIDVLVIPSIMLLLSYSRLTILSMQKLIVRSSVCVSYDWGFDDICSSSLFGLFGWSSLWFKGCGWDLVIADICSSCHYGSFGWLFVCFNFLWLADLLIIVACIPGASLTVLHVVLWNWKCSELLVAFSLLMVVSYMDSWYYTFPSFFGYTIGLWCYSGLLPSFKVFSEALLAALSLVYSPIFSISINLLDASLKQPY